MLVLALYAMLVFFAVAQLRILVLAGYCLTKDLGHPTVGLAPTTDIAWPTVAVQLPVYREYRVLGRLIEAVTELEYTKGQLCVQVLDDSEAEEAERTRKVVDAFHGGGVASTYVHRGTRDGYKSGALNHGTRLLDCELIAIFDADFVPERNFLMRTVPSLAIERVGAVHTRWRHRNDTASALTMLQAAVLDSLFCFESATRQASGESSMYLGTSGVWRRRTIEELGGWREAPFTDDGIDLSFRARLAGWLVVFVNEALASSDLPETYVAYKNQQRRWARAALRLFLDYGRGALQPAGGAGRRFLELSSLHLVLSTPALIVVGVLTGAQVALGLPRTAGWTAVQLGLSAALVLFPPVQEGILAQRLLYRDWKQRCLRLLPALPLGIGVSVSILAGFRDTFRRDAPEFVRTPKQGAEGVILTSGARWVRTAACIATAESALGGVLLAAGTVAVVRGYAESWFLLFALAGAFLTACGRSWSEIRRQVGHASPGNRAFAP